MRKEIYMGYGLYKYIEVKEELKPEEVEWRIVETEDGGFIIVGSKLSQSTTNEDVWILKLTHDLSTEWDYTYGGSADDIGTSVNQTTDGGYIITGNTYSYGNQSEIILLKLNSDGIPDTPIGNLNP